MGTKYDYIGLRNQFVQGTMSIRELCRQNDIATWSAVNKRANDEDWLSKRAEFQRQVEARSLDHLAQKRANKVAEIQVDALDVIHSGILKMAADMDAREPVMDGDKVLRDKDGEIVWRPVFRYTPAQFATLIEKFQTLIGAPNNIGESRSLNVSANAEVSADDMRAILAGIRSRAALAGGSGSAEEPDPANSRSN